MNEAFDRAKLPVAAARRFSTATLECSADVFFQATVNEWQQARFPGPWWHVT